MATRRYGYNKCEVVGYIGDMPITPTVVFGYAKVDNFASVYSENNLVLTPIQNGKLNDFVDGDRLLFRVNENHTGSIQLSIGGSQYDLVGMDGAPLDGLSVGYVSAEYQDNKFVMSEETLDEADYVYCDFIIRGCVGRAERYMNYDITEKTYRAFRNDLLGDYLDTSGLYDDIDGVVFVLRRNIDEDSVVVTYTGTDGQVNTVDKDNYYVYDNKLVLKGTYPTADKLGVAAIQFNVVPELTDDLCAALLQHISEAYESRGMCSSDSCPAALSFSDGVKKIYDSYRIINCGE